MRTVLLLLIIIMAQERATLITPEQRDLTVRSYEVVGFTVQIPPATVKLPILPTAAPPTIITWNLTIHYMDNLGTEYIDMHNDPATTPALIAKLLDGTGSIRARLLQHLIDEKKILPARITK